MLNLPIDLAVAEAPMLPGLPAELLPPAFPTSPAVSGFAGLMAAQVPAAAATEPAADPSADLGIWLDESLPELPVIAQDWALALVPELGNLPAQILLPPPPVAAAPVAADEAGAAAGDAVAIAGDSPWPQRDVASPRLAGLLPADPARPRGWQAGLPAAPTWPRPSPTTAASLPTAAPDPMLRNIAGQPMAHPAPWVDPRVATPWIEPTKLPPALVDPARIPAAWIDPARPAAVAASVAAAPNLPATTLPTTSPPAASIPPAAATPRSHAAKPQPTVELASPPEPTPDRADALLAPIAPPAVLPIPVVSAALSPTWAPAPNTPPPPAAAPTAPPPPTTDPALAIASDRLGDVAIKLSGGPDQLQVTMQAQPAAAALIGAEAPRLSLDLAAAGIALAGLNINGQRADLSGGQRDRQRQPGRRGDDAAPLAGVRRLNARSAAHASISPNPNIDRFA